ncbi:MAG TPA: pilin [Rhodanobacter sp.]|nr:pilin [Rhodanobacter sp.]
MTDPQVWIGQNGEKYGPYDEALVRQWMREGKFAGDALAWREGMPDWVTLASLFPASTTTPPPPMPPPLAGNGIGGRSGPDFPARPGATDRDASASLPEPPSLHWALVWLFAILSLGIFGIIWRFIQANWIRKIDPQSKASLLLGIALGCFFVGYILYFVGLAAALKGDVGLLPLGGTLLLANWVLLLISYFSMADSMRRRLPAYGLRPEIGGITLFFFTTYYLQGQLSWVARWKRTGQTSPGASKGIFWALFCLVPFVIAILAAISIPAYQDYLIRTQVSEGMVLADGARTAVAEYYANRHALPADNAIAGLASSNSITGRYVSGVTVSDGAITVSFGTYHANRNIRNDVLVLAPSPNSSGGLDWRCGGNGTTVPQRYLPSSCRQQP